MTQPRGGHGWGNAPLERSPGPGPPAQPGPRPTPQASLTRTARSSLLRGRPLSGRLSHRPGPAAPPQPPTLPAAGPGSALARAASTASRALRRPRPRPARRSREAGAEAPGWALRPPASRGDTPLQSVRARGPPQPRLPSPWLPPRLQQPITVSGLQNGGALCVYACSSRHANEAVGAKSLNFFTCNLGVVKIV